MATRKSAQDLLAELRESKEVTEEFNPVKELGQTRSKIALIFVRWYFYLLGACLVFLTVYNIIMLASFRPDFVLNPKDILLIITSAIGSPLGFVIGYYFKESDKSSN